MNDRPDFVQIEENYVTVEDVRLDIGFAGYFDPADDEAQEIIEDPVKLTAMANLLEDRAKAAGLGRQVGGTHYQDLKIQPMEFSFANDLNALQHSIIKYATRAGTKLSEDTRKEIHKIIHCAELWLELLDKYPELE